MAAPITRTLRAASLALAVTTGAASALTVGDFEIDGTFTIDDGDGARTFRASGRIDGGIVPDVDLATFGDYVFSTELASDVDEAGVGRFAIDAEIPVNRTTLRDALGPWLSAITQDALSLDLADADLDRVIAALVDPDFEVVALSNGASFAFGIDLDPGAASEDLAGRWRLFVESRDPSVFPEDPFAVSGAFDLDVAVGLAPIPLPAGLPLLLAALGSTWALRRRARR